MDPALSRAAEEGRSVPLVVLGVCMEVGGASDLCTEAGRAFSWVSAVLLTRWHDLGPGRLICEA